MFATSTRTATTLLLAVVATLTVAVDSAAADSHPATPSILWPIQSDDDTYVMQVNGGAGTWQIRRAARRLNAQLSTVLPQVQIRTKGDCATADVCVNVVAATFTTTQTRELSMGSAEDWKGLTTWPTPGTSVVYLNNGVGNVNARGRYHTAAHELGHVLGLAHHDERAGLMSNDTEGLLSVSEIAVLAVQYAPRA